ncbi:RNA polymerase sigma factor [Gammaproteobacteria bacterium 2W06]|nr:RNA polymerase sigma factor [Gammaproteobacteria bacterium 2W06]
MKLTPEREQWLLEQAKMGREHAFRELVQHLNPRVFRIARGVLDSEAEAEDAVQESYVKAFSDLAHFRGEARLATWVGRITLNTAMMMARKRRPTEILDTVGEVSESMSDNESLRAPTISRPDHASESAELRVLMEAAISTLSPKLRLPFMLYELEGLSVREIAEQLDIQVVAVKTRVFRARRHLRDELAQRMGGINEIAFHFAGDRCAGMADQVVERLVRQGVIDKAIT